MLRVTYILLFCTLVQISCGVAFQRSALTPAVLFHTKRGGLKDRFRISSSSSASTGANEDNGDRLSLVKPFQTLAQGVRCFNDDISRRWEAGCRDFREKPWTYLTIPVVAGLVGYVTNWLGVKMLFYPVEWKGVPIKRWPLQPLGLIGWQGIVPCKRMPMTEKMVDVTISQLLKISEVFQVLNPKHMAKLLEPSVRKSVLKGFLPSPIMGYFLRRTSRDVITNVESIVNIKDLVVKGMTTDPTILGTFFQKVGRDELKFLVDSGLGVGFLLGIAQMVQCMIYPHPWAIPIGGAFVGYITNWIALKLIFEPLNPINVGPFVVQGLFLKRQREVSAEFCTYLAGNVLTSFQMWKAMLRGPNADMLQQIIARNVPLVSKEKIMTAVKGTVGSNPKHSLHKYIDATLNLREVLISKMNKMTPAQFEQILHPIFQEDEITLIMAGGVLGFFAGLLQMWGNEYIDERRLRNRSQNSDGFIENAEIEPE